MNRQHTKKDPIFRHAKKRALERYGLHYTKEIEEHFVDLIQSGKSVVFAGSSSNRRKRYYVLYNNHFYGVIYDESVKSIITFLSLDDIVYKWHRQ